jgi:hypothetical protein
MLYIQDFEVAKKAIEDFPLVWHVLFFYHVQVSEEAAGQQPEPNEQAGVEILMGGQHNCLEMDHQTEWVQSEEEEQAIGKAGEEEEQATGVQGSVVVQGYRSFVRLVRLVVRSIAAYSS